MLICPEEGEVRFFRASGSERDRDDDAIVSTLALIVNRSLNRDELEKIDPDGILRKALKFGNEYDSTRGEFSSGVARTSDSRYTHAVALDERKLARASHNDLTIPLALIPSLQELVASKGHVVGEVFLDREATSMLGSLATALEAATPTPTATPSF